MALGVGAMVGISAGTAVLGGFVSGRNAKKQAERENEALRARIAWMQEEKKFNKKIFEINTFAKAMDTETAGAQRIAATAGLGIKRGSGGVNLLNDLDQMRLGRDLALDKMRHDFEMRRMDNDMAQLEKGIQNPDKAFWGGFLTATARAAPGIASAAMYGGKK